ncbi:MAG: ATP-binding cassette domain-containing protein, partial [Deltaproteobacteria bacterium]|nr:ATP-binding cassette domain-containing protein [Deltaproteobacteria bacterium]
ENVTFALNKDEERTLSGWLDTLYRDLNVAHLLRRNVSSLSGGEAQRVTLGRALAKKPRLLLLDEPFTAIDKELRPHLRGFLKKLHSEWQIPTIVVTHDTAEAHVLGDRIFEMEAGNIIKTTVKGEMNDLPLMSY